MAKRKADQAVASETFSYNEALARIEEILEELGGRDVDIDRMAPLVEEAARLLKGCEQRLSQTEVRVREALAVLQDNQGNDDAAEAEEDDGSIPF